MTFFTTELLIQLITSFITSVAFAVMFRVHRRHLVYVGICGTITYAVYYTVLFFNASLFAAGFISSMVTALYAEVFARLRKVPTIVFVLTGVVPTVPGGNLYRSMRDLVLKNMDGSLEYFSVTLEIGIGIAGGIVTVSILFGIWVDFVAKRKARRISNSDIQVTK